MSLRNNPDRVETSCALLGGAIFDVTPELRIEANDSYFNRGTNPVEAVLGAPFQTFGGSALSACCSRFVPPASGAGVLEDLQLLGRLLLRPDAGTAAVFPARAIARCHRVRAGWRRTSCR